MVLTSIIAAFAFENQVYTRERERDLSLEAGVIIRSFWMRQVKAKGRKETQTQAGISNELERKQMGRVHAELLLTMTMTITITMNEPDSFNISLYETGYN